MFKKIVFSHVILELVNVTLHYATQVQSKNEEI